MTEVAREVPERDMDMTMTFVLVLVEVVAGVYEEELADDGAASTRTNVLIQT